MNFIIYFFTWPIVYACFAVLFFGPVVLMLIILKSIAPSIIPFVDTIVGIIGILLIVLLIWFSHQATKRFAYWHLSFVESFKDTFKAFKYYVRLILP